MARMPKARAKAKQRARTRKAERKALLSCAHPMTAEEATASSTGWIVKTKSNDSEEDDEEAKHPPGVMSWILNRYIATSRIRCMRRLLHLRHQQCPRRASNNSCGHPVSCLTAL